jgi:hypothetical protein
LETKYHEKPAAATNPPKPPKAKNDVTSRREASSALPRRLRRPFRNIHQRSWAMAKSWFDIESALSILGEFNSCISQIGAAWSM